MLLLLLVLNTNAVLLRKSLYFSRLHPPTAINTEASAPLVHLKPITKWRSISMILRKKWLFSNHSAVKREQIIFTLETMKRRQESGIGISFIDS